MTFRASFFYPSLHTDRAKKPDLIK